MDDERRDQTEEQQPKESTLAAASLYMGLGGLFVLVIGVCSWPSGLFALALITLTPVLLVLSAVVGIVALVQIRSNRAVLSGQGSAVGGIVLSMILGLLMWMMAYALSARYRPPRQTTMCLNNLKQIGTAVNMYMSDWDDRYPLVSGPGREFERVFGYTFNYRTKSDGGERRWFQNLCAPYAKNKKIFMCPSQGEDAQWRVKGRTVTYYWNRHGGYTFDAAKTPDMHGVGNPEKKAVVKAPRGSSTEGLLLENDPPTSYWFNAVAVCNLENGGTKVISGQSEEICARTADAPIVWDTPCGFAEPGTNEGQIAHEDVINVCYADGHAKPYQIPNPKLDEWTKDHFGNTHGYEGWFEEY